MDMVLTGSGESGLGGDARRDIKRAMARGFRGHCPRCGEGRLFYAYLKVSDQCPACGAVMAHQRADDAPPYIVMMIVGHLLVTAMLLVDDRWTLSGWVHAAIWMPLAILLSLWLLPRVKGAIVGMQWANRMHGFADG
jgi:uncharacterized protein (DUF983 family)